jgi:hypothetical protein
MRSIFAIGGVTFRECVRDPIFAVILIVFAGLIVLSGALAFFGLGREAQMAREMGLSSLMLGGLAIALLSGVNTVVEERAVRTALPTLAKPVSRRCLVIGKYFGIMLAVAAATIVLAAVVCAVLWAREGSGVFGAEGDAVTSPLLVEVCKAAVLTYFEVAVIAALATGLAFFLSRLVTVSLCLALFTVGHLTDEIIRQVGIRAEGGLGGALIEAVPRLEYFRVATLVAERESVVSASYLLWAAAYAVCGGAVVLLISAALFEKRELG